MFRHMTWRAIPIAGLVAGIVFLLVNALVMTLVYQSGAWLILRYIASLVMGTGVLGRNDVTVYLVGFVVHLALSMAFTLLIAVVVHRWGLLVGIIGGALLGLALYSINIYFTTRFFEWFFALNSIAMLLNHVLFGAVAGGVYEVFDRYDRGLAKTEGA